MRLSTFLRPASVLGIAMLVGCMAPLHQSIETSARTVPGGREVKVSVTQPEIRADIAVSTAGASFGLIGALVDVGVNNARATEAEKTVQTLRDSLVGYDFDGLVQARTRETVARIEWLGTQDVAFSKDFSLPARSQSLDGAKTGQVLFTDYYYSVSPDFSAVRLAMTASIANKAKPAGMTLNDRFNRDCLVFIQPCLSEIPLASPSKKADENARRWAADNGKLVRQALETALARTQMLLELSLSQTPKMAEAAVKAENVTVGTYRGKLVEKTEEGTLLRLPIAGRLVFVAAKGL